MEALALNGTYNPNSIKSKADAMRYAFDLTTERNFSTGATKIDVEKQWMFTRVFLLISNCQITKVQR